MPRHVIASLAAVAALSLLSTTAAQAQTQHHAHTHGVVELDVAIDRDTLTLALEAPLDSLVGFERAPRNAAEKQRVQQALQKLRAADALFAIDPAAQCRLQTVELSSEVLGLGDDHEHKTPEAGQAKDPNGKAQAHDKHEEHEEHADLDGSFVFTCAQAAKASYLDVRLFSAFPRIRTVNAQIAAPGGQFKRGLRKDAPRLSWAR